VYDLAMHEKALSQECCDFPATGRQAQ